MKSNYKFQTIVATETDRNAFTELRGKLNSTDKQLFGVIFAFALANEATIAQLVADEQVRVANEKAAQKEVKLAAKQREKELEKARAAKQEEARLRRNAARREKRAAAKAAAHVETAEESEEG